MKDMIAQCPVCGRTYKSPLEECSCKVKKQVYDLLRKSSYEDLQKNVIKSIQILRKDLKC